MTADRPPDPTEGTPSPARRPRPWRRVALTVAGWAFIVLGVLGLFLPILQGLLFLAIGLLLLARVSPRARLIVQRLRRRFPWLDRAMRHGQDRLRLWRGRLRRR